MGKETTVGQVVKEYLGKYPQTATKTIASMLYRDNKELFTNLEHARSAIRYYRGASGKKLRKDIVSKEHFRITDTHNPFNLPEPDTSREVLPYIFPKNLKRLLILSDLHIPYHDIRALTVALEYGRKNKIDSVLINGDGMDFYATSRFATDPRKRDLAMEIEKTREFIKETHRIFPKAEKFWKLGNHEERWEKYLWTKAPEILGIEDFELHSILKFEQYGYTKIESRAEILIGNNLTVVHGHEFQESMYSPVNPARGLYLRYEDSAICGHYHRPSHHSQKTGRGKIKSTWSTGCLCLLRPEYSTLNKWQHGFAFLVRESEHEYHLKNFTIIDGKIYES